MLHDIKNLEFIFVQKGEALNQAIQNNKLSMVNNQYEFHDSMDFRDTAAYLRTVIYL